MKFHATNIWDFYFLLLTNVCNGCTGLEVGLLQVVGLLFVMAHISFMRYFGVLWLFEMFFVVGILVLVFDAVTSLFLDNSWNHCKL